MMLIVNILAVIFRQQFCPIAHKNHSTNTDVKINILNILNN